MPNSTKTFYKILEVDSEASPEVIEAAYKRLARRYHPDLNPSPEATKMMQELNEAYSVVSDPQKRISYDLYLRAQAERRTTQTAASGDGRSRNRDDSYTRPKPEPEPEPPNPYANPAMPTACQGCGRSNATLRFAAFPYVISALIVTFRRGDSGLYCSTCRRQKMSAAKVLTFLFGWWGIPWGPIYSLVQNQATISVKAR